MRKPAFAIVCALALALALASCSSSTKSGGTSNTGTTFTSLSAGSSIPSVTQVAQTIDPCTLLTAAEASQLAGATVTRSSGGGTGSLNCIYAKGTAIGAEVSVKVDSTPAAAHTEFPNWVQPIPGVAPSLQVTVVPNLGNEASETRNGKVNAGIYARKGATLVKIGVHPAAASADLVAAAKVALGRV